MATAVPAFEDRTMSIGRVFQRAFATIAHNPLVVLGIAGVLGGIPTVLMNVVTRSAVGGNAAAVATNPSAFWGATIFSWVVAIVIGAVVQGALTRAVVADNDGHRASFGDCVATAVRVLLPLIGVGFVFGLGVWIGMILLIVPGIIIMVMWSVAGPALVVERDGVMMALSRSSELTSGSRWKIFALFLLLLVIYGIIFGALGVVGLSTLGAAAGDGLSVGYIVASAISAILLNLIWGTVQPSLYVELREAKEGKSLENLEQVFA
jgi:hypothetical protein